MSEPKRKYLKKETEQGKLNTILTMQRQNDIIQMLLDGKETKEIASYISNKYRVQFTSARTYVNECREIIKQREKYEIENLISLHVSRYEKIYKETNEIGDNHSANRALEAKEKLLGFHREGFHMKVSQGEIQEIRQMHIDNEYDLVKLTKEKRDRFSELINKCKREGRSKKK